MLRCRRLVTLQALLLFRQALSLDQLQRRTTGKWASIPQPTGRSLSLSSLSYSRPATTQPIFEKPVARTTGTSRSAPEPSRNARTRKLPFTLRTEVSVRQAGRDPSSPHPGSGGSRSASVRCSSAPLLRPHDRRSFRRSLPRGMGEACVNRPLPARECRTSRFGALAGVVVTDITLPDMAESVGFEPTCPLSRAPA